MEEFEAIVIKHNRILLDHVVGLLNNFRNEIIDAQTLSNRDLVVKIGELETKITDLNLTPVVNTKTKKQKVGEIKEDATELPASEQHPTIVKTNQTVKTNPRTIFKERCAADEKYLLNYTSIEKIEDYKARADIKKKKGEAAKIKAIADIVYDDVKNNEELFKRLSDDLAK
ncbi:hypothetical protein E24_00239 [Faustovirus]|nr:hypothetical protein PRJ_Fausto_00224 [Faustovirus]AMN83167.1 hypothetical protein E24_00239 [Faustovirus]AMN84147.1 hypothetical protein D5a_00237 [Faustovirus]AMN85136.1 hypothetical protein E23_00238 [Faustovirus]QBR99132.1 hypothetical protein [Faustovirus mariensis]